MFKSILKIALTGLAMLASSQLQAGGVCFYEISSSDTRLASADGAPAPLIPQLYLQILLE